MKNRQVTATEFKAKCLALLDEVNEQRDTITITKRGRPVAMLQPVKRKPWKSLEGVLAGKVEIIGDIVNSHMPGDWTWDAENLPEYWAKSPGRGKVSSTGAPRPRPPVALPRRGKSA
jgi:prevent-host-death family protein